MPEQWRTNVQYLLMIYADQAAFATMTPEQGKAMTESYAQFTQDIVKSGHLKGGDRLKPANTATTIRLKDGKPMMTDGPFAETREQLAGYYLIEAKDLFIEEYTSDPVTTPQDKLVVNVFVPVK